MVREVSDKSVTAILRFDDIANILYTRSEQDSSYIQISLRIGNIYERSTTNQDAEQFYERLVSAWTDWAKRPSPAESLKEVMEQAVQTLTTHFELAPDGPRYDAACANYSAAALNQHEGC